MTEERFYCLSDNSFAVKGAPWISGAYAERTLLAECPACKTRVTEPNGTIELRPDQSKGSFWSDVIGCGGGIMGLYLSARVMEVLKTEAVRYGKAFPAEVGKPFPKKLAESTAPQYFYVTGELGAKFDFEGSGYRIQSVCSSCGTVKHDPASNPVKDQFIDGSWNGSDIFYTDLSPTAMYCGDRILGLARLHRWTNFRFVPLQDVHNYSHKGIDYLKEE